MVRLSRVPVFVSTLALVTGCTSADRVEVTGVVRDGRTGSPVAGARVTGADGAATHTDADGRFTIAVTRGLRTQLRVSAEGHTDAVRSLGEVTTLDALDVELDPVVITDRGEDESELADPDAVLRFSTADWVAERFSRGHAEAQLAGDGEADAWTSIDPGVELARRPCPALHGADDAHEARSRGADEAAAEEEGEEEEEDLPIVLDERVAPWLGSGSRCVECHRSGGAGIQANVVVRGSHAGLGDSCLSCHASDGAFEARSCARCHGEGISYDSMNHSWFIELDAAPGQHPRYDDALARARDAMARRLDRRATLEAWITELEEDGSRGAHDPRLVHRLLEASLD